MARGKAKLMMSPTTEPWSSVSPRGTGGREAFRWTSQSGMVGLGKLSSDPFFSVSYASAVSGNGEVIIGHTSVDDGASEAFVWTAGSGNANHI